MRSITISATILMILACAAVNAATFFPLGVWYEGGVGAFRNNLIPDDPAAASVMYQRDFADMAAHGVNAAVVPNTQPNHHKVLLDAAQASHVKLIVELDKEGGELGQMVRGSIPFSDETIRSTFDTKLKPIMRHPALMGVQLLDEPQPDTYERYAKIEQALNAYAPKLLPFSCLIGNGPVDPFCKTTKSAVCAFDCYPLGASKLGDEKPIIAYDQVAHAACVAGAKHNTPIWAVIQAHSWGAGLRTPTPAEMRCMTYLALANGCKGVWWFLYQTELDGAGNLSMQGLVDPSFNPTERWDEVGRLTREIRRLVPTLLDLSLADGSVSVTCNSAAHVLKDKQGRTYIFAVNTDATAPRKLDIRVDASAAGREPAVTALRSGKLITPDIMAGKIIWSETLAPGDGELYLLK